MAWKLEGDYFGNCSCDVLCPCLTSYMQAPADTERCLVPLVARVDDLRDRCARSAAAADGEVSACSIQAWTRVHSTIPHARVRIGSRRQAGCAE